MAHIVGVAFCILKMLLQGKDMSSMINVCTLFAIQCEEKKMGINASEIMHAHICIHTPKVTPHPGRKACQEFLFTVTGVKKMKWFLSLTRCHFQPRVTEYHYQLEMAMNEKQKTIEKII